MSPPTPIAVAVVEQDDRFLIGLREDGVALAGYWEFPGGKILPGESPAEAAVRECREETGLEVEVGGAYPDVMHTYDHGTVHLHFLACRPKDPQQVPAERFRWVARGDLASFRFPPANAALVASLVDRSTGSSAGA